MKPNDPQFTIDDSKNRKSPFKIPDGYFDSLNHQILQQIEKQQPIQPEKSPGNRKSALRSIFYLAAMFAGAFLMIRLFTSIPLPQNQKSEIMANETQELHPSTHDEGSLLDDYAASSIDEYTLFESYCEKNQQ